MKEIKINGLDTVFYVKRNDIFCLEDCVSISFRKKDGTLFGSKLPETIKTDLGDIKVSELSDREIVLICVSSSKTKQDCDLALEKREDFYKGLIERIRNERN